MPSVACAQDSDVTLSLPHLHATPEPPKHLAEREHGQHGRADGGWSPTPSDTPHASTVDRTTDQTPSFRAIFDAHYDYVWLSLRRLGVHDRDREDVTNEVFFRVHGRLGTYDPSRPMRPWLFAFAVRAASDYRKLARHRRERDSDSSEGGYASVHPGPGPDEHAIRREEQRLVASALETLDLPQRSVFVMHELDQVPVPTIAEALGIPLGTAYTRLRSARQDFAAAVRRLSVRAKGVL